MPHYISVETRKEQAAKIHNNRYDYSLWPEKIQLTTKVTSICLKHGNFTQTLRNHITKKFGCPKCGRNKAKETWIETLGVDNPSKSKKVLEKKKQTSLKNYDVEHPRQNAIIIEKTKKTNQKRYGGNAPACSPNVVQKAKNTNLERYTVEYPSMLIEFQQKAKNTNLKRYNVEYPQQNEQIQQKTRKNNLKKYGVEHIFQIREIREQIQQSFQKLYGGYPQQNEKIKQKTKNTNLERYDVEYPQQNKKINQKTKTTNLERYGVEYPLQSTTIQKKIKQQNLKKHGVVHSSQFHIPYHVLNKLNNSAWLKEQHHVFKKPLCQISNELGVSESVAQKYAKRHNIDVKYFNQSIGEQEIGEFLQSLNVSVISRSRSIIPPYELDIFLPDYNIAIEYNGDYWHGDDFPEHQQRDIIKNQLCNENNIILLTIWESYWKEHSEEVKNDLKFLLE